MTQVALQKLTGDDVMVGPWGKIPRPPLKKSLFPVQRVAEILASQAAAISFFFFFSFFFW